jgi:hypothetical protein
MKIVRNAAVGLALLGAVVVAPGAADAAPAGSVPVGSGLVPVYDGVTGTTTMMPPEAATAAIVEYWTPERRAAAVEDVQTGPATGRGAGHTPKGMPQQLASAIASKLGGEFGAQVVFTHTDGKVFYHDPIAKKDKACSGGAVNSGKKRLAWTAGHCVHGGPGKTWMTNWAFDPGYQFGPGPAGVFPAHQLWAQSAWFNNGNHSYDYGVAITQNNAAGWRLVDRVGGNGLIINPGRPFVTAIAYPSNFNNGEQQAFCQGQLSARSIFNSDQKLNCDLRFGASGGPWLKDYNDAGLGDIVSNQSYSLNADGSGPEYGPYYDSDTAALYNAAENASP